MDVDDYFGTSVSLDGDRLAVGATSDDGKNNATADAGAVYIFKRTGTTWALERKVEDGSDGFNHLDASDLFGVDISLDGDRLAVGASLDDGKSNSTSAPGAAYIFKRTGTTWALERKIENGSDGFSALDSRDNFGSRVSLDGDRLAVGAPRDAGHDNGATNAGAVYMFERTKTTWTDTDKFQEHEGLVASSWQNFKTTNTTEPSCNSSDTFGTASNTADSFTITSSDNGKWACFRVKDSNNVYSYVKQKIGPGSLTLTQDNTTVTASGSNFSNFAFFDSGATDPDCSSTNTTAVYTSGASATALDDNDWVCFKGLDQTQVYVYAELQVDLTAPVISLAQDRDSVDASATMAGSPTIDSATWSHSNLSSTNPTCSSASYNTAGSTENTVAITIQDNNKYVCFRVKNSLGVSGYGKIQISLGPGITLTQNNTTVTATSTDGSTLTDYKYFSQTTKPTNCGPTKTTGWTTGTSATSLDDNDWVCFTAKDSSNTYGYGLLQVDLTAPTISLTQTGKTVTATGSSLTGYQHFTSQADPACDNTKTTGWTDGSSKTNLADDTYICFRAKNNLGVYGYGKLQVDLTAPTISLTQDGKTVSATGSSLTGYQHFTSQTDPACDSTKTTGWTDGSSKTNLADDTYICFRAQNSLGVYGYGEIQVDLTAPIVSAVQVRTQITATATTTNGTIKTNSWTNLIKDTSPTCASETYTTPESTSGKTINLQSSDNNKYYCFRVKNSRGIYGYTTAAQIDLTAPIVNIVQDYPDISATSAATDATHSSWKYSRPQTSSPTCSGLAANQYKSGHEVFHAQDNKYYCFRLTDTAGNHGYGQILVNLTAPSLNVSQNNTTVTVSGTSLSGYSYQKDAYSLPCNPTLTTNWKTGKTVTNLTHKTYVCFRAKNSLGVWGFSQYQVDLAPPGLTLDQSNSGAVSLDDDRRQWRRLYDRPRSLRLFKH